MKGPCGSFPRIVIKIVMTTCKIIIWLNKEITIDVKNRSVGSMRSKDQIFGS